MKEVRNQLLCAICSFSLLVSCLCLPSMLAHAQPNMPIKSIPPDTPQDVRHEIERLYSSNPAERGMGAHNLGKIGERARAAVPFLIAMFNDYASLAWSHLSALGPSTSPAREAALALGNIKDPRAVAPLIAAALHNTLIREAAVDALRDLGDLADPHAVEAFIAALNVGDIVEVRTNAAYALGKLGGRRAVNPLVAAVLREPNNEAARALSKLNDPRAVDLLIAALNHADIKVRGNAALAFHEIADPRAVAPLIAALKDWNEVVRACAARAFQNLEFRWEKYAPIVVPAVEALIAALKDDAVDVRRNAALALRILTREQYGDDQAAWQQWWKKHKERFGKQ